MENKEIKITKVEEQEIGFGPDENQESCCF